MNVYRIVEDVNLCQSFCLEDESLWQTDSLLFDCAKKKDSWNPPSVYVLNPKLKMGNFIYLIPGALICDQIATEALRDILEMSGELLPILHEGKEYTILNVTECVNALNQEKTEWKYSKRSGAKIGIAHYSFHMNRFPETSLFKIPETSRSEILTYSGLKDPEDEFITICQKQGLTGLLFEELWSD